MHTISQHYGWLWSYCLLGVGLIVIVRIQIPILKITCNLAFTLQVLTKGKCYKLYSRSFMKKKILNKSSNLNSKENNEFKN